MSRSPRESARPRTRRCGRAVGVCPRHHPNPPWTTPTLHHTNERKARGELRIVVADDNALLREGIASLLEEAGHEVVGRAADADDLLLKVRSHKPDVAIVDVRMPPRRRDDGLVAAAGDPRGRTRPSACSCSPSTSSRPTCSSSSPRSRGSRLPVEGPRPRRGRVRGRRRAGRARAARRSTRRSSRPGRRAPALGTSTSSRSASATYCADRRGLLEPAIAKRLYLRPRAVERHVQSIFEKLRLPETEDDNRRVLAVLALLGQ